MKKAFKFLSLLVIVLIAATAPMGGQTFAAPGEPGSPVGKEQGNNGVYIVQMVEEPVVAYEGGIRGLRATAPKAGQKINPFSSEVVAYVTYLDERHNAALNAVGGGRKLYDYRYSLNGFAAELTPSQAAKLAATEGVLHVTPDELHYADTSSTPDFLGLTQEGTGLWDQLGGIQNAGEGIIIGIVDTGIWPESLSFSDRTGENGNASKDGKLSYQQVPGWHGRCVPGEEFTAANCNQKLIGAQYFNAAWGGDAGIDAYMPSEFTSPRDYDGHGTHTASTAGGNYGVPTTGAAAVFGNISGIAPRARIAAYKALWGGSGWTSDLVAAIDQAVADGVDVINYSISGSSTDFLYPTMRAFLFAARAGVFVAASAGNAGPTPSTVAHAGPWVTTVAAGTHNRTGNGSVTLGDGTTYNGASVATPVGPAPLVDSIHVGIDGANYDEVEMCYPGTLDPAKVTGNIVICKRGVIARVDKSLAVMSAGGVGMILYNDPDSSLNADFHFVPTVHVDLASGLAIKAYAATASATATINQSAVVYDEPAPLTASFSSRGPLRAGAGDLLKPDLIAPGQDILAAVAPPGNYNRDFDMYSGTSMSSPHVAGLAALLKDMYPNWSPMMIKSALMTTGYDVLDGPNTDPAVIFSQGAGHVQPNASSNPGLVYNANWNDWLAFLCGTTTGVGATTCSALKGAGYSTDPSDYNVASIAIGALAGQQTVVRRVTNVGSATATYTADVTGLAGVDVVVSPASLTLKAGQTKSFTVSFTTTTAMLNAYVGGYLNWSDGTHNVRIPLVVRPVALSVPGSVFGTGGPISYDVTFGYNGSFSAAARGLVPAAVTADTVADDPTDGDCTLTTPNAKLIPVTVPAGTTYARFSLFDADVNAGSDLDLCVFDSAKKRVGLSAGGTSSEEVNLLNPAADTYTVVVQGWGVINSTPFKLYNWVLGDTDAGNMSITAPTTAVIGQTAKIELNFSNLTPATKYLGSVVYGGAAGMPNPTIVRVDMP